MGRVAKCEMRATGQEIILSDPESLENRWQNIVKGDNLGVE